MNPEETDPALYYLEQSTRTKLFAITQGGKTGPEEMYITWFGDADFDRLWDFSEWMNINHRDNEDISKQALEFMYHTFKEEEDKPFSFFD